MKQVIKIYIIIFNLFFLCSLSSQTDETNTKNGGWFSLGARSTLSAFSDEGAGIGTGGQFRIQLADQVNTEWFADYITINIDDKVRSDYYHIGWSVMFYPLKNAKKIKPYILAGHCFDYNRVTLISSPSISVDRWGSAVQAGLATHFNITERFDLTLSSQYMVHLSTVLRTHIEPNNIAITEEQSTILHGHLLTTISLNYKIGKLWNK
ncbi:MAG: hypothetical protein SGJ15_13060 [Bacteroidota bacterium]|nr:hypothetical protein [Bacteroidota bacterium]